LFTVCVKLRRQVYDAAEGSEAVGLFFTSKFVQWPQQSSCDLSHEQVATQAGAFHGGSIEIVQLRYALTWCPFAADFRALRGADASHYDSDDRQPSTFNGEISWRAACVCKTRPHSFREM
jgi:hypothetical protein